MKRKDEYIVGHPDRGIVAAVAMRDLAQAIASQLWREHPKNAAYVTHRGQTWRYTGQWGAEGASHGARNSAYVGISPGDCA